MLSRCDVTMAKVQSFNPGVPWQLYVVLSMSDVLAHLRVRHILEVVLPCCLWAHCAPSFRTQLPNGYSPCLGVMDDCAKVSIVHVYCAHREVSIVHLYRACAAQRKVIIMCLDPVHIEVHEQTIFTWGGVARLLNSDALSVMATSEWQSSDICWHA